MWDYWGLGLLLHWLPTLRKQQAGFLRLRRAPERFISWDDCFSVQMAPAPCELFITGGRNLPAARCRGVGSEGLWGGAGTPSWGGGFPDLGKGSSAPTSRQGQWVTDCTSKPQICSFLPLLCSTEGGHPPAVAEAELGAAGVLCAPLRGEVLHFVLCPFWLPLPPPRARQGSQPWSCLLHASRKVHSG